ncbi:hypothetical protein SF83666_a42540 (plasmid) [Sinorhizobium fredii CCBAU 83666]|nr:hypothetical protein SF83666_a42540 [Sinorhizobium fredii CCBAU 83666]
MRVEKTEGTWTLLLKSFKFAVFREPSQTGWSRPSTILISMYREEKSSPS